MAISPQALELSSCGTGDDGIGLLRLAVLEYPAAFEHERSRPPTDSSDEPLQANERCRAVAPIHHEVLDLPFPLDITSERFRDLGPSKSGKVVTFAVRRFVPRLDGEPRIRALLHGSLSAPAVEVWSTSHCQKAVNRELDADEQHAPVPPHPRWWSLEREDAR